MCAGRDAGLSSTTSLFRSDGDDELDLLSEDLETALKSLGRVKKSEDEATGRHAKAGASGEPQPGETLTRHEVVDDFVRNFLLRMGMSTTLDSFEAEWVRVTLQYRILS